MKIKELFKNQQPTVSFEFFPAKTPEGKSNLIKTIRELKPLGPSFVSMTYGAGGGTRNETISLVSEIKNEIGIEAAAHLTCVGHSKAELEMVLKDLEKAGIENVVALRGDPPKGQTSFKPHPDGFAHASQLVALIRKNFSFNIAVAGYPEKHIEAASLQEDLSHLKEKISAGGDVIITQLFFNNKDYFSYVEQVHRLGITAPVLAGIMPITDVDQIKRFAQLCGAKLPPNLIQRLESAGADKEQVIKIGIQHAIEQCRELLKKGAPGIHFYTLNKSRSTQEIFSTLKEEGLVGVS